MRYTGRWPASASRASGLRPGDHFLSAVAGALPPLLLTRVAKGIASPATRTAGLALLADSFVRRRTFVMGIAMAGSSGGALLGRLVGGSLLELRGYRRPSSWRASLLAVHGVLRLTLVADAPRAGRARSGLGRLLGDRGVLAATPVVALGAGAWSLLEPLLPLYLGRERASALGRGGGG